MAPQHKYTVAAGTKLAIFSYRGCTLEIYGQAKVSYVGRDTPMIVYSNVHENLQQYRAEAKGSGSNGPRVSDLLRTVFFSS